jgi:hypothetical protein
MRQPVLILTRDEGVGRMSDAGDPVQALIAGSA